MDAPAPKGSCPDRLQASSSYNKAPHEILVYRGFDGGIIVGARRPNFVTTAAQCPLEQQVPSASVNAAAGEQYSGRNRDPVQYAGPYDSERRNANCHVSGATVRELDAEYQRSGPG